MKKEKRNLEFKDIEVRSSESDGKKYVEGKIPYDSKSVPIWGTTEIIDRTAFNKTLSDNSEVRALWNHNDTYILGSTKSKTLSLENSDTGLICRCELPNTSYANDLYEIITRGDVRTMSFGFTPIKWQEDEKGKLRTLKEVQLHEVSFCVLYPAYEKTTSKTYMRGLEKNNINIEQLNDILEKDNIEDCDKIIIKNTIDNLNNIIGNEAAENEQSNDTQPTVGTLPAKEDTASIEFQIEAELLAA
jgi:HK97 family phage prohead protease